MPSLFCEIGIKRVKVWFETFVHIFKAVDIFPVVELSIFIGGDEGGESFLAFQSIDSFQLFSLIIESIVEILDLSFEIIVGLLKIGVTHLKFFIIFLDLSFVLFEVDALLLSLVEGFIEVIDLSFVVHFHLFWLSF